MDRNALLLGDARLARSRIIEIGPSHAPVAAKRAGWRTTVVDHASAADLRAKYADFPVDLGAIEEVDHIWAGGRLDVAVPAALHGSFDRLIASHVIEHIPDFVTFFVAAQALLAAGGVLALAVPDKRYCFDALKPLSTTGDMLAAYAPEGAGRHTRRTLFNQVAYSVGMDGAPAWGQHPVSVPHFMNSLPDAIAFHAAASEAADSPYVDAHAWQFTPASFQLAILELAEAGLIDWRVAECSAAQGSEFIVTLRRGRLDWSAPGAREARRMELLLAMLVEAHEQIAFAAHGGLIKLPESAGGAEGGGAAVDFAAAMATQDARFAAIEGHLEQFAARLDTQQRTQFAAVEAHFAALAIRLDTQQRRLDEVHLVAHWVRRMAGPFYRLRARLLGRP